MGNLNLKVKFLIQILNDKMVVFLKLHKTTPMTVLNNFPIIYIIWSNEYSNIKTSPKKDIVTCNLVLGLLLLVLNVIQQVRDVTKF